MANALAPQNPLAEVAELFGKDGLAHKDLDNLTVAIDSLISTLEKRAGKEKNEDTVSRPGKNPRDPYSDGKTPRSLKNDLVGFGRGLVDSFTTDPKQYLAGKSSLPDTIEKIDPTLNDAALTDMKIPVVEEQPQDITQPATIEPVSAEQPQPTDIEPVSAEQPQPTDIEPVSTEQPQDITQPTTNETSDDPNTNKVLSDMVEVLIDLRDDKTQNQILQEAIEIKKIIFDQSKKIELPGGVEPNSDAAKQEDREKLAEAIATRLKDVMGDMGSNSPFGIDFDFDKNKKGKPVGKGKVGKFSQVASKFKMPLGVGMAARGVGTALGVGSLALGAYDASEFLDETGYGDKMNQGAGKDAEKAFRENVAPTIDPAKAGVTKDQATAALENGSPRDIEKLGGRDALMKIAGLAPVKGVSTKQTSADPKRVDTETYTKIADERVVPGQPLSNKQMAVIDMSKSMGNTYSPEIEAQYNKQKQPVTVEPKPTVNNVGKILDKVTDQRTELKADMSESKTQMIAPIVSNKTINNTEQTIIGTPPSPHPSTNSFLRFQNKISGYTDSVR